MKLSCPLVALAALSVAFPLFAQTNQPLTSAVSVSRQFTVYAPGLIMPASLCAFAERLKHDWTDTLALPDNWRDPIVLVVREQAAAATSNAPITIGLIQVGPLLKYEIDCRIPPPLDEPTMTAAIVEALCLEFVNRDRPRNQAQSWQSISVPTWLTEGLAGALAGHADQLLSIARRSAKSAHPPEAASLMSVTRLPSDPRERELFTANAWLFTDGLTRVPGGQHKLQHFLMELRRANNVAEAFQEIYHGDFPDAMSLEKWWSLQQARLNIVVVPEDLTARETSRSLDEILTFQGGLKLDQLEKYADQPWLTKVLPEREAMLRGLLSRAHPLYRPVLEADIEAIDWLIQEKLNRYLRAVHRAETLRAEVDHKMAALKVALDRIEAANSATATTNTLDGYLRAIDQLDSFEKQRRNPISDYLDKFDR